jgi:hypothetical protein
VLELLYGMLIVEEGVWELAVNSETVLVAFRVYVFILTPLFGG